MGILTLLELIDIFILQISQNSQQLLDKEVFDTKASHGGMLFHQIYNHNAFVQCLQDYYFVDLSCGLIIYLIVVRLLLLIILCYMVYVLYCSKYVRGVPIIG